MIISLRNCAANSMVKAMAKNSSQKLAKAGPLANLPVPFLAAGVCAVVIVVIGLLASGNRPRPQPDVAHSVQTESPKPSTVAQQPSQPSANVEPPVENPVAAVPSEPPATSPPSNNDAPESPAPVVTITLPAPTAAAPIDPVSPAASTPATQPPEVPDATAVASSTPTPPPTVPQTAESPTPTSGLPDEQAIAAARTQVLEMFGAEARAATNPDLKLKLADKMMNLASEKNSDPAIRYVLYDNARKLYIGAGEVQLARQAAQDLSTAFRLKLPAHYELIFTTYTSLSDATLTDQQREQLQDMLGTSVSVHLREKEVKEADQISSLRMKVVARLNDAELKRKASAQRSEVLKLKAEASATRAPLVRPADRKQPRNVVAQSFDAVRVTAKGPITSGGEKLINGWEFKTKAEITVTHLGIYDKDSDGLTEAHDIAIWEIENELQPLVLATIPAGARAFAHGPFRIIPINRVQLKADHNYAIVAHYNDSADMSVSMVNPTRLLIEFNDHLEVIGRRHAYPHTTMAFPNRSDPEVKRASIGPTFRYEALELKK
jgi:hypothetical protein